MPVEKNEKVPAASTAEHFERLFEDGKYSSAQRQSIRRRIRNGLNDWNGSSYKRAIDCRAEQGRKSATLSRAIGITELILRLPKPCRRALKVPSAN